MIPYKLSSLIGILIMLSFFCTTAQTNELDFNLTSNQINISGQDVTINSTITKSDDLITWIQENNGNSDTTHFSILSSSGSWDQMNSTGTIMYDLDDDGYTCSLSLNGSGSNIMATITYHINETEQHIYTFNINTISYQ